MDLWNRLSATFTTTHTNSDSGTTTVDMDAADEDFNYADENIDFAEGDFDVADGDFDVAEEDIDYADEDFDYVDESTNSAEGDIQPTDGRNNEIPENLTCPICLDLPLDKVFQCKNGHILCEECYDKVIECPQCRLPFGLTPIRTLVAETLLDQLTVDMKCRYEGSGCTVKVNNRKTLRDHVQSCRFRPVANAHNPSPSNAQLSPSVPAQRNGSGFSFTLGGSSMSFSSTISISSSNSSTTIRFQ